jgi:3-oxoacyl-[acyl-carrier protein] reductase
MNKFKGRTAIVTGAGQGIGRGIALCLAEHGANVVLIDLVDERLPEVVAEIEAKGVQALGVQADVSNVDDVNRMVEQTIERFKRVDILVNNAGTAIMKTAVNQTEADWDAVLDLNLKGVFLCCQRVLREMIDQKSGAILNIASIAAMTYTVPHVPYAASKAGVVALTRDLAYEVARHGVRVNAIAPGMIETPLMQGAVSEEQRKTYESNIPLGRFGQPEDIGEAVAFLVSDAASFITGVTLPVSGGSELRIVYG